MPRPGAYIKSSAYVRITGLNEVNAKLAVANAKILAHNRAMVNSMLEYIKPVVIAQTPVGPGHFGFHLRERYTTDISEKGTTATGVLKAPMQGYWREYGTKHQRAFLTAHAALEAAKKVIGIYYSGRAVWWRRWGLGIFKRR